MQYNSLKLNQIKQVNNTEPKEMNFLCCEKKEEA